MNKYGGINDVDSCDKRVYSLWYQMLRRCYDKEQHAREKGKSYKDCEVCDRWKYLSNFAKDITKLKGYKDWKTKKGYCIDKDTIHPNSKLYCKENCCFIPYTENIADIHKRKPKNIKKLHEQKKVKYMLVKDDEILIFNSEKEACEYMGVVKCSIASCYRKGVKCKGYKIAKMDKE